MHIQSSALCNDIFIAHSTCEGLKKKYKNTKYCSLQSHCFIQINKISLMDLSLQKEIQQKTCGDSYGMLQETP